MRVSSVSVSTVTTTTISTSWITSVVPGAGVEPSIRRKVCSPVASTSTTAAWAATSGSFREGGTPGAGIISTTAPALARCTCTPNVGCTYAMFLLRLICVSTRTLP